MTETNQKKYHFEPFLCYFLRFSSGIESFLCLHLQLPPTKEPQPSPNYVHRVLQQKSKLKMIYLFSAKKESIYMSDVSVMGWKPPEGQQDGNRFCNFLAN